MLLPVEADGTIEGFQISRKGGVVFGTGLRQKRGIIGRGLRMAKWGTNGERQCSVEIPHDASYTLEFPAQRFHLGKGVLVAGADAIALPSSKRRWRLPLVRYFFQRCITMPLPMTMSPGAWPAGQAPTNF